MSKKITTSEEIREAFLAFFESKKHKRLPSASLVPVDDPSLLLINAGMAPMKRFFEGRETPPAPRCCSSQKCIRTIDIDEVGRTNRHNTFFEMLGNFSFGDYFKKEAIQYCWEFMTSPKWMGIPPERLYSTVHEGDDEAYAHWEKIWRDAGFEPKEHLYRLGDKHNFWAAGATGPCGYDSEVYFDLAPDISDEENTQGGKLTPHTREWFEFFEDNGRLIEVWNNVFMEFNRDEAGVKTPLPKKNVDTGMGFERLVLVSESLERERSGKDGLMCVFQSSLFDYLMTEILTQLEIKKTPDWYLYDYMNRFKFGSTFMRTMAIADHVRAATFLLADGVTPTNEGRGYVLRRLIRRAVQIGYGIRSNPETRGKGFIVLLAEKVIMHMGRAYPELKQNADKIKKYLAHEENQFLSLLARNYDEIIVKVRKAKKVGKKLSGNVAFLYHDSHGFPVDVTRDLCAQFGVELDEEEYERLMKEQKARARAKTRFETDFGGEDADIPAGEFAGYDKLTIDNEKILAAHEIAGKDEKKGKYLIATARTPFYAEAGGQPADHGLINVGENVFRVVDSKTVGHHIAELVEGDASEIVGQPARLSVDRVRRQAIARAHTATHLLHRALKDVLGNHVQQAGSQLREDSFRFDFSHTDTMSEDEIAEVERLVRGWIAGGHPVITTVMPIEEAKALGVTALFDEKYGQIVRVVTVGTPDGGVTYEHYPWVSDEVVSRELCGGTHVAKSSDIGGFAIIREESVSAGMRRITAAVGGEAWKQLAEESRFARRMKVAYNLPFDEIETHVEKIETDLKLTREKLIREERRAILARYMDAIGENRAEIARAKVVAMTVENVGRESLKFLADRISEEYPDCAVLLGENVGGKAAFVCKVPKSLIDKGIKAGDVVKTAAQACGGGGGGRPDFAEAGGKLGENVPEGIEAGRKYIKEKLG